MMTLSIFMYGSAGLIGSSSGITTVWISASFSFRPALKTGSFTTKSTGLSNPANLLASIG